MRDSSPNLLPNATDAAKEFNFRIESVLPFSAPIEHISSKQNIEALLKQFSTNCQSFSLCWARGLTHSYIQVISPEAQGLWVLDAGSMPIQLSPTDLWVGRQADFPLNSFILLRSSGLEPFGLTDNASGDSEEVAIVDGRMFSVEEFGNGYNHRTDELILPFNGVYRQRYFRPRHYILTTGYSPLVDIPELKKPIEVMIEQFDRTDSVSVADLSKLLVL